MKTEHNFQIEPDPPKVHLQEQLGFLKTSCEVFDKGIEAEAKRIALTIRVLIHQTSRSVPILARFPQADIQLLSTVPNLDASYVMSCNTLSAIHVKKTENGFIKKCVPMFLCPLKQHKTFMSVQEWYEQVVCIVNELRISRKDIILGASNKDGGAHLAEKLSEKYAAIKQSPMKATHSSMTLEEINNNHFADLRQMAFELLNSPSLLALAG